MWENEELHVINEVGVFGLMDIEDPTAQKVNRKKSKKDNIDEMINEAITENYNTLTK